MKIKENEGITLVALVITIIVLLILAGVTINMVLDDNGIIAQAKQAQDAQEKAEEKEKLEIAKVEAATLKYANQDAMKKTELEDLGFNFEIVDYNNSVAKLEDGVPIPVGFAHVQGTTKDQGLIVVDGYGNEFVWVPVDNPDTFTTLTEGYSGGAGQGFVGTEPTVLSSASNDGNEKNLAAILEADKYSDLSTQFTEEYNNMVESIKTYGGFYVGRYETSWTGSRVASVANVVPMKSSMDLGSTWITRRSDNKATWYGLYAKQKELYNKESDSVVSGMIYGAEWDAIMNWMKDIKNPNVKGKYYTKNSKGMGVYLGDDGPLVTGQHKVNNIYDLAGNYLEFTQEAYSTSYRVGRGGGYNDGGSDSPASYRRNAFSPRRFLRRPFFSSPALYKVAL